MTTPKGGFQFGSPSSTLEYSELYLRVGSRQLAFVIVMTKLKGYL